MKTSLPRLIAFFSLMAFHAHAEDADSVESQAQRVDAAIKRVLELSSPRQLEQIDRQVTEIYARLASGRKAASEAYEVAARARMDHEIIDPDPESTDVIVSASERGKGGSILAEYARLKRVYIEAKNKLMKAEQEVGTCRLTAVNLAQMTVNSTSREVSDVFKKLSELIENGEVADPNPDDAKSEVTFNSTNKETAEYYTRKKAKYLELKAEAAKARIEHGAAIVDESRREACRVYKTAFLARRKNNLVDPDPESAEAAVSPKNGPAVAEYLQHKKTYLAIHAEIDIADAVFPFAVLQAEAKTAADEMAAAFAQVTGFLQSGKVMDPKPEDPNSAVEFGAADQDVAKAYIEQKAGYLASKLRSNRAQKALEAANARK